MSELVEDAIASWCGDIVGHFWLVRNWVDKLVELKFEFFSFNTFDVSQIFWQRVVQPRPEYSFCILLKGLCWVSVSWILYNALCSMSWMFSGFYCVPNCVSQHLADNSRMLNTSTHNIWQTILECYTPQLTKSGLQCSNATHQSSHIWQTIVECCSPQLTHLADNARMLHTSAPKIWLTMLECYSPKLTHLADNARMLLTSAYSNSDVGYKPSPGSLDKLKPGIGFHWVNTTPDERSEQSVIRITHVETCDIIRKIWLHDTIYFSYFLKIVYWNPCLLNYVTSNFCVLLIASLVAKFISVMRNRSYIREMFTTLPANTVLYLLFSYNIGNLYQMGHNSSRTCSLDLTEMRQDWRSSSFLLLEASGALTTKHIGLIVKSFAHEARQHVDLFHLLG